MFGGAQRIGISVSDASLEAVEIAQGKNGARVLRSFASAPLAAGIVERGQVKDPKKLGEALARLMTQGKPAPFESREVSISLPDVGTYFHRFVFPGQLSDGEISSALQFQIEDVFPYTASEVKDDFCVVKRAAEGTDVLYAVAPRDAVSGYVQAASHAGVKLVSLELEALCLWRAHAAHLPKGKAAMVVDLGARATNLVVGDDSGLRASFVHPVGGADWTQAIAKALGISVEKAEEQKCKLGLAGKLPAKGAKALVAQLELLAREMRKAMDWYERQMGHPLTLVLFTGGGSRLPGLREAVKKNLAAEVELQMGDPWFGGESESVRRQAGLFAPAIGAALSVEARATHCVDFLRVRMSGKRAGTKPIAPVASSPKSSSTAQEPVGSRMTLKLPDLPMRTRVLIGVFLLLFAFAGVFFLIRTFSPGGERDGQTPLSAWEHQAVTVRISTEENGGDVQATKQVLLTPTETVSVTPGETVPRDAVATGTVVIINESETNQSLVATTRFLSESGVLFRLQDPVIVPAGGSVDGVIYADQPGANGNIPPSRFTIPGLEPLRQSVVYATSAEATAGGVVEVGVLTQADLDRAGEAAVARAQADMSMLEPLLVEGQSFLPSLVRFTVREFRPSVPVGTETSYAEVAVQIDAEVLIFEQRALDDFFAETASEAIDVDLDELSSFELKIESVGPAVFSETGLEAEVEFVISFYPHP